VRRRNPISLQIRCGVTMLHARKLADRIDLTKEAKTACSFNPDGLSGKHSTMGMHREKSESDQVDDDQRQRPEAMCKNVKTDACDMNAQNCTLPNVTVTRFRIARTFCGAHWLDSN
jgi:hypothetical protein